MGKALLLIVLGSSVILANQLYNTTETEARTAKDQNEHREDVIAREIAASAFNVGMGEMRPYGAEVYKGAAHLNGTDNKGRSGTYSTGRFAGGSYTVRAEPLTPHSARIVATGTFGDAEFTMHDDYDINVLTVTRGGGYVDVKFLQSLAGYCSAVFYQAYTTEMAEGTVPEVQMLFPPSNRKTYEKNPDARPVQTIYVEEGTQMNFFIAVTKSSAICEPPPVPKDVCKVRADARDADLSNTPYDHIHYALDVEAGKLDQAQESIWGFVEQHPDNPQRWRIAWEDLHRTDWDSTGSTNPATSLQALKQFGYDELGWREADVWGYRQLIDYGDRPDFSDQVIEVTVVSTRDPNYFQKQTEARYQQYKCGESIDQPIVEDPPPGTPADVVDKHNEIENAIDANSAQQDDNPEVEDDALATFACDCTKNDTQTHKRAVLHRPPGNESNEQLICIASSAVEPHFEHHNDVFPTCTTRRNVRRNNGKKK